MKGVFQSYYYKNTIWILLLYFSFFNYPLTAQLPGQNINLSLHNKPIEQVLEEFTRQSGFLFTYNAEIFSPDTRLSIEIKDLPVLEALDSIFNDPSLRFILIDKNIVIYRQTESSERATLPPSAAEAPRRVKGIVTDKQENEPLPFATILIKGSRSGTVSNLKGEFSLVIPPGESPLLEISMMGYKNAYFPASDPSAEPITIGLERDVISLQEVIIRYQNPFDLLRRTIAKIPGNYMDSYASMTSYFREYVQRNTEYISYSEAVLAVDKAPYDQPFAMDAVRVIKGRKLKNISSEDSLLLKIQSGVSSSLQLDIVKNLPLFLSPEFEAHYYLQFRNLMRYKGKQVYVISFHPAVVSEEAVYQGELYINSEDLAIVAADFSIVAEELRRAPERFMVKKSRFIKGRALKASYHAEYRKTEDSYHINMVTGEVIFRLRKRNEWLGSRYRIGIEMAVTEIQPGVRSRIPRAERLKPSAILSEQEFSYDPEFWGDYNIIEPEASLRDALKRMGIEWEDFRE